MDSIKKTLVQSSFKKLVHFLGIRLCIFASKCSVACAFRRQCGVHDSKPDLIGAWRLPVFVQFGGIEIDGDWAQFHLS